MSGIVFVVVVVVSFLRLCVVCVCVWAVLCCCDGGLGRSASVFSARACPSRSCCASLSFLLPSRSPLIQTKRYRRLSTSRIRDEDHLRQPSTSSGLDSTTLDNHFEKEKEERRDEEGSFWIRVLPFEISTSTIDIPLIRHHHHHHHHLQFNITRPGPAISQAFNRYTLVNAHRGIRTSYNNKKKRKRSG